MDVCQLPSNKFKFHSVVILQQFQICNIFEGNSCLNTSYATICLIWERISQLLNWFRPSSYLVAAVYKAVIWNVEKNPGIEVLFLFPGGQNRPLVSLPHFWMGLWELCPLPWKRFKSRVTFLSRYDIASLHHSRDSKKKDKNWPPWYYRPPWQKNDQIYLGCFLFVTTWYEHLVWEPLLYNMICISILGEGAFFFFFQNFMEW